MDHLTQLNEDLTRVAPPPRDWQRPDSFDDAAQALSAWLAAAKDPDAPPDPAVYAALEVASNRVTADSKAGREQALEELALRRAPATDARAALATLTWSDSALHHSWRLADSIRIASGGSMPTRTG